jgi:hypothetical protein
LVGKAERKSHLDDLNVDGKAERKSHLDDLNVDGKIILKWFVKK